MATNPEWETILTETLGAFLAGKLTFSAGRYTVTVAGVGGAPARFTFAAAIAAAEHVFLGSPGELQVGNVLVDVSTAGAAAATATPAAAALAAAIAASVTPSAPAFPSAADSIAPGTVAPGATIESVGLAGQPAYPVHTIAH